MRLRARFANETVQVGQTLAPQSTYAELKRDLANALKSLDQTQGIKIKTGFPPKFINNNDLDTLTACGIKDGDQLLVEVDRDGLAAPATVSAPAVDAASSAAFSFGGAVTNSAVSKQTTTSTAPIVGSQISARVGAGNDELIPVSDGHLLVRQMNDDNSCLFHSIAYIFERGSGVQALRQMVAKTITTNPIDYNEAILGKPVSQYTSWIQSKDSWGGAIELAIFSSHYQTEIWSLDVSTLRVDKFGEGCGYDKVAVLFYSGIHYDAVAVSPVAGTGEDLKEFDLTVFGRDQAEREVMKAIVQLGKVWQAKHKFTDLARFALRCDVCKEGIVGQKEAQAHAMATGHSSFVEYS